MRIRVVGAALAFATTLCVAGTPTEARGTLDAETVAADAIGVRELLEGSSGRREAWETIPELVILSGVMQYTKGDPTAGYVATGEQLPAHDLAFLGSDFAQALEALTGGRFSAFSAVRIAPVIAGQTVQVFRRGQIVVGRFKGVQAAAGTVGYGGRTTRNGAITAAVVILDHDFDKTSERRQLLRTHELGHALGYNHVEARRSVMNPRMGAEITDFDRTAIEAAFAGYPGQSPPVPAPREALAHQN